MHISTFANVRRVGSIRVGNKPYKGKRHVHYPSKLALDYDINFPKELRTANGTNIYLFVVDGEVYKIGYSNGNGGINSTMGFYLGAGFDDPGPNRFAINALIREKLAEQRIVEVWIYHIPPTLNSVFSAFGEVCNVSCPVDGKPIEHAWVLAYKARTGHNPPWNFQESSVLVPQHIHEEYLMYENKRREERE